MTLADLIKWVEAHPTTIGIVLGAVLDNEENVI